MIVEMIMLKLCFNEGQWEEYLEQQTNVVTVINASYDEEKTEPACFYISIEEW